jgi:hypothetical protein
VISRDAALALWRVWNLAAEQGLPVALVLGNVLEFLALPPLAECSEEQIATLLRYLRRRRHCDPPTALDLHVIQVKHAAVVEQA